MEIDEDEAFLYGDAPAAVSPPPAGAAESHSADASAAAPPTTADDGDDGEQEDEGDEDEESDDDLEIILDGEGVAPAPQARRPLPVRPPAVSPQKPNIAPAPSATTEYAPLDRPGLAKATSSTSVGPPTFPHPDAIATDQASTAALAAQAIEGTPNPDLPMTPGGTPLKATSTVTELVPRGSLVPLELRPASTPTFDVNAVQKDANGNDLFDVDLDALEDKPWRRPGANMADYFNYGMNEATWKNYARKQRELRGTESAAANPFAGFATGNIQQAWADLTAEQKQLLMGTIMGFQPGAMPPPAQMAQMAQMGMMAAQMGGMPPGAAAAMHGGMGMNPMVAAMGMQGMGGMGAMGMQGVNGMSPAQQVAQRQAQLQAQQLQAHQAQQQQKLAAGGADGEAANGLKREESESGATPARGEDGTPAPSEAQEELQSGDIAGFGADAANPAFLMNPLAARGRGGMMGARGGGVPAGPGMRGGAMAMRGRGGMAMGAGAAVPTGPRAALPGNVPTGPRAGAAPPTGPRVSAARSYRDKDVDRFGTASGAGDGGLDYGAGAGGGASSAGAADEYDRSPVRSRSRRESPDYGRDSSRRSSRYERSRSRERSARDRERDREFERERDRERRRADESASASSADKKRGLSDFFPDKRGSRDDRSASPGLRIRGTGGAHEDSPPRRSSSRREEDRDEGHRSRGGTYSRREDEGETEESRKRKAEDEAEGDRSRRRSTRRD